MPTLDLTDRELVLLQDALDDLAQDAHPSDEWLALQVRLHFLTGESMPPTREDLREYDNEKGGARR